MDQSVALRKESVDRNLDIDYYKTREHRSLSARRAWIEMLVSASTKCCMQSLSARRAWIEIPAGCWRESRRAVALRKESVDRNMLFLLFRAAVGSSLSARRAWIEINVIHLSFFHWAVALRKESVDRNC